MDTSSQGTMMNLNIITSKKHEKRDNLFHKSNSKREFKSYSETLKLNKDINPTKVAHLGITPSNLLLSQQECNKLLR
ncbi:hypothetical protein CR513_13374, partial [Mucuna pruriens]